jgi:hypothetical protein
MKWLVLLLLIVSFAGAVSLQDAEDAYLNASLDIQQLKMKDMPVASLEDALDMMDAKLHGDNLSLLLEKVSILNASNESDKMALASQLSGLIQNSLSSGLPVGANYSFVVEKALWVRSMKDKAFESAELLSKLQDSISAVNESVNLSAVLSTLQQADDAFLDERYGEVPGLVDLGHSQIEDAVVNAARERAFMRLARRNVVDFVQDHWRGLLIALAGLVVLGLWTFFEVRTLHAFRKIRLLEIELGAVEESERSTQQQYYSEGMGSTTYKARMTAFKQRQRQLKTDIQVWHSLAKSYRRFTVFSRLK